MFNVCLSLSVCLRAYLCVFCVPIYVLWVLCVYVRALAFFLYVRVHVLLSVCLCVAARVFVRVFSCGLLVVADFWCFVYARACVCYCA